MTIDSSFDWQSRISVGPRSASPATALGTTDCALYATKALRRSTTWSRGVSIAWKSDFVTFTAMGGNISHLRPMTIWWHGGWERGKKSPNLDIGRSTHYVCRSQEANGWNEMLGSLGTKRECWMFWPTPSPSLASYGAEPESSLGRSSWVSSCIASSRFGGRVAHESLTLFLS
jgi:hypothetical protein